MEFGEEGFQEGSHEGEAGVDDAEEGFETGEERDCAVDLLGVGAVVFV